MPPAKPVYSGDCRYRWKQVQSSQQPGQEFHESQVQKRIAQVEASIARYLDALERADREDSDVAEARTARLKEKIAALKRQMQSLKEMGKQVEAAPDKEGQRGTSRGS